MVSAIISLVFGLISLIIAIPIVIPVIGLALGANALIKERKKEIKTRAVVVMSTVGIVVNSFITIMFVVKSFAT
jgi:hypothetical protein